MRPCTVDGCGNAAKSRGMCPKHWERWHRYGDPLFVMRKNAGFGKATAFLARLLVEDFGEDCVPWPYGIDNWGRPQIRVNTETGSRPRRVGTILCEAVHGPRPHPKAKAVSTCGLSHKNCVNRNHFAWGDQSEVEALKIDVNTSNQGEGNGCSKLTENEVRDIKDIAGSMSDTEIGRIYGVTRKAISRIRRGVGWKHLFENEARTPPNR